MSDATDATMIAIADLGATPLTKATDRERLEECPGSGMRPSASHRRVCADQPALCPVCDEPFDVDTTVIPEH